MRSDCIDEPFRALVLLATHGGLRFGELAGLRRARIDVLRGRVTVAETLTDVNGVLAFGAPKTKRSRRVVPLPRTIIRELETDLGRYTGADGRTGLHWPQGGAAAPVGVSHCWWHRRRLRRGSRGSRSTS
jgi:integrase